MHMPANRTLFFAEMTLSPVVAAIALLVPAAAHWGAFEYVPAFVWFLILAQCLLTFRWRGLWFLLGPPIALVAITGYLMTAPPVSKSVAPAPLPLNDKGKPTGRDSGTKPNG